MDYPNPKTEIDLQQADEILDHYDFETRIGFETQDELEAYKDDIREVLLYDLSPRVINQYRYNSYYPDRYELDDNDRWIEMPNNYELWQYLDVDNLIDDIDHLYKKGRKLENDLYEYRRSYAFYDDEGNLSKGGSTDEKIDQFNQFTPVEVGDILWMAGKKGKVTNVGQHKADVEFDDVSYSIAFTRIEGDTIGGDFDNYMGRMIDWKDFELTDLVEALPPDVEMRWITDGTSTPHNPKVYRIYDKGYKKLENKRFTITDYGYGDIHKGSENLYFDFWVYDADPDNYEDKYEISLYTKDNHSGLKEFANSFVSNMAKGGMTKHALEVGDTIIEDVSKSNNIYRGIPEGKKRPIMFEDDAVIVKNQGKEALVDLDKGKRANKKKKGKRKRASWERRWWEFEKGGDVDKTHYAVAIVLNEGVDGDQWLQDQGIGDADANSINEFQKDKEDDSYPKKERVNLFSISQSQFDNLDKSEVYKYWIEEHPEKQKGGISDIVDGDTITDDLNERWEVLNGDNKGAILKSKQSGDTIWLDWEIIKRHLQFAYAKGGDVDWAKKMGISNLEELKKESKEKAKKYKPSNELRKKLNPYIDKALNIGGFKSRGIKEVGITNDTKLDKILREKYGDHPIGLHYDLDGDDMYYLGFNSGGNFFYISASKYATGGRVEEKELKKDIKDGKEINYSEDVDGYTARVGYREMYGTMIYYIWFNGAMVHSSKTFNSMVKKLNQLIKDYDLEYEGEEDYASGGFVSKGELVWGKLPSSDKIKFLNENFTPNITPRTQELLVNRTYQFLPKKVKIVLESKYANVEDYAEGGSTPHQFVYLKKDYGYRGKVGDKLKVRDYDKELGVLYATPIGKEEEYEYEQTDVSVLPIR